MRKKYKNYVIIALIIVIIALGATIAYLKVNPPKAQAISKNETITVTLYIIPDYGGPGYDAFVLASNFNGTLPTHATNSTPPGFNNNTIIVPSNVPIKFIIINLDTMVFNITTKVTVPFTVINDTEESGQVATTYTPGMQLVNFPASHTFTINQLNINIPIPPSTIVTFTYTFTQPGQYVYDCITPCGPGMGLFGYMQGYLIVK
jgi:heme/copper-type cytochrome/quinol oxidase subunit 2